jgi:hypothetical protein
VIKELALVPAKEAGMKEGLSITRIYRLVRVRAREFVLPTGGRSRYEDGRALQVAKSYSTVAGRIAFG